MWALLPVFVWRSEMIICSSCKAENSEDAIYCCECGSRLEIRPKVTAAPVYPTMRGMEELNPQRNSAKYVLGKDKKAAAAFSAFLPAGGQVYNGDFKKALPLWGLYILALALATS